MFCIHMRWYITFLVFSDWNISCFDICWQWRYFLFNYCSLLRWSAYHEQQRSTHQKISRKKQWLDSRSVTRWQHYLFSSMAMLNCSILPNSQRRFKFCTLQKPPPTKSTKEFEKYPSGEFFPVLVTLLVAYTRVLVPTSVNQNNSNLRNIVTKIHD